MVTAVQQLGNYVLESRLAVGGMAEVFLARRKGPAGFEKKCVVKCILPFRQEDEQLIGMFLDEARLAARLTHPNIVQIYELGQEQGVYFIAMEYIPGLSLAQVMQRLGSLAARLPYHYGAMLGAKIAAGLAYAHDFKTEEGEHLRLVHRDVSPENVLLGVNGAVKTIDFGIAKAATNRQQTAVGVLKGKCTYMSPEQIVQGELDGRSDIFSLGIVLAELLTGVNPYTLQDGLAAAKDILDGQPTPPSRQVPGFPPALEAILMKTIAKRPEERYQSARDLQRELERVARELGPAVSDADLGELVQVLERGSAAAAVFVRRLAREGIGLVAAPTGETERRGSGKPATRPDLPAKALEAARTPAPEGRSPVASSKGPLPASSTPLPESMPRTSGTYRRPQFAKPEPPVPSNRRTLLLGAAVALVGVVTAVILILTMTSAPTPRLSSAAPGPPTPGVPATAPGGDPTGTADAAAPTPDAEKAPPKEWREFDEALKETGQGILAITSVPRGVLCEVASGVVTREELKAIRVQPGVIEIACDDPSSKVWRYAVTIQAGEKVTVRHGTQ